MRETGSNRIRNFDKVEKGKKSIVFAASLFLAIFACVLPAPAQEGQFFPPYPPSSDGSWPLVRHDPYNSDFSQNHLDPMLNYAAGMDTAWQKVADGRYPPIIGETPEADFGGLDDVSILGGFVLDETCEWLRLGPGGEELRSGTGLIIVTTGKATSKGVPNGTPGYPHVVAYGKDGTLLWTSDQWLDDADNWVDEPGDEFDDFNPDSVSIESQLLPGTGVVTSSVLLDDSHRIYVVDSMYMWAADAATGDLLWKWRMPSDDPFDPGAGKYGSGLSTPFVTAFFTVTGEIGGVHASGRVTVFPPIEAGVHGIVPGEYGATYIPDSYATRSEVMGSGQQGGGGVSIIDMTQIMWYPGKVEGQVVDKEENPELWMLDPDIVERAAAGMVGISMPVTNTPAVSPDPEDSLLTRIFIPILLDSYTVVDGDSAQDAALMRVDFEPLPEPRLWEPWKEEGSEVKGLMPGGRGSATSPDISESGTAVFLVDQNDTDSRLYAFSAETGDLLWEPVLVGTVFGSVTTTWDGDDTPADSANGIDEDDLVIVNSMGRLIVIEQHSGEGGDFYHPEIDFNLATADSNPGIEELYRVDVNGDGLEDVIMPELNGIVPIAFISSDPVASRAVDENWIPVPNKLDLLFPLAVGYPIVPENSASFWPVKVMLIAAQRSVGEDGTVTWSWTRLADIRDVSETSSFPDGAGNIWVSHVGTQTSLANGLKDKYPWILRYLGWGVLLSPRAKCLWPVEPRGGITKIDRITCAPSVTCIDPQTAREGERIFVEVRGEDFASGACLFLERKDGGDRLFPVKARAVARDRIVGIFNLHGALAGTYDVVVTNPDIQEGRLAGSFEIVP